MVGCEHESRGISMVRSHYHLTTGEGIADQEYYNAENFILKHLKIFGSQESSVMAMAALTSLPFDINVISISHQKF
jgi:hypothetical protein